MRRISTPPILLHPPIRWSCPSTSLQSRTLLWIGHQLVWTSHLLQMVCRPPIFPRIHFRVHILSIALLLSCIHFLSKVFSMPFPFCVSCVSIHDRNQRYLVQQAYQLHLLAQDPKTYFLEPTSLAPPCGLEPDHCPGALKVLRFNWFEMYRRKRGNSRDTGVKLGRKGASVSVTTITLTGPLM